MTDLERPRPYCDYHEDRGDVLWWRIPICEPPYVGSTLDMGYTIPINVEVAGQTLDTQRVQIGGWPFDESDERHLWWTPLPDAKRIEDQVPL